MRLPKLGRISTLTCILLTYPLLFSNPVHSQEDSEIPGWCCALSLEGVSKYLWRGAMMHDGPALQPGLELTRDPWTAGLWASYNIGRGPERTPGLSDLYPYIEYSKEVPHLEILSVDAGFTLYTYPLLYRTPGVHSYSPEVSLGISFGLPGAPTFTCYKDFFFGSSFEAALSHAQPLSGTITMESEITANYLRQERVWSAMLFKVSLILDKSAFFAVNVYYQAALSRAYDNTLFLGVAISK